MSNVSLGPIPSCWGQCPVHKAGKNRFVPCGDKFKCVVCRGVYPTQREYNRHRGKCRPVEKLDP